MCQRSTSMGCRGQAGPLCSGCSCSSCPLLLCRGTETCSLTEMVSVITLTDGTYKCASLPKKLLEQIQHPSPQLRNCFAHKHTSYLGTCSELVNYPRNFLGNSCAALGCVKGTESSCDVYGFGVVSLKPKEPVN